MLTYILCADGACSGNPGPGGYAWELWENSVDDGNEVVSGSGRSTQTTNNIMELKAALEALEYIRDGIIDGSIITPSTVKMRLDSQYVLKGIFEWMAGWKAKGWSKKGGLANSELWIQMDAVVEDIKWRTVTLEPDWVKGHDGDMGNERVDDTAVAQRDLASEELRNPDYVAPGERPVDISMGLDLMAVAEAEGSATPFPPVPESGTPAPVPAVELPGTAVPGTAMVHPSPRPVTGYVLVENTNPAALAEEVNTLLKNGFQPQGGIATAIVNGQTTFFQAVHR